jgi:hypothetical protein
VDDHEELLFTDLTLFNRKLADWLVFYNTERPHHSLGQQSPLSFLLQHQPECQRYWTHTPTCDRPSAGSSYLHDDPPNKLEVRDRLIRLANLSANTCRLLDVGCGRGLRGIGFAKIIPNCCVTLIDCWNEEEIQDNRPEWIFENARRQGCERQIFGGY